MGKRGDHARCERARGRRAARGAVTATGTSAVEVSAMEEVRGAAGARAGRRLAGLADSRRSIRRGIREQRSGTAAARPCGARRPGRARSHSGRRHRPGWQTYGAGSPWCSTRAGCSRRPGSALHFACEPRAASHPVSEQERGGGQEDVRGRGRETGWSHRPHRAERGKARTTGSHEELQEPTFCERTTDPGQTNFGKLDSCNSKHPLGTAHRTTSLAPPIEDSQFLVGKVRPN